MPTFERVAAMSDPVDSPSAGDPQITVDRAALSGQDKKILSEWVSSVVDGALRSETAIFRKAANFPAKLGALLLACQTSPITLTIYAYDFFVL